MDTYRLTAGVAGINETEYRAYYFLTRRCDLDCWYCNVPRVNIWRRDELALPEIRTMLANLKGMGVDLIVFGGGEPVLRRAELEAGIREAIWLGIYTVLLTNGRLLVEYPAARAMLSQLVSYGLRSLSVSVDRLGIEDPQGGSEKKSVTGLQALELGKQLGMTDLGITTVLSDGDPLAARQVADGLEGSGYDIRLSYLQAVDPRVETNLFQRAERPPQDPRFLETVEYLYENRERLRIRNTPEYFQLILQGAHHNWACWKPGHVVIGQDGRIQLCQNVRGSQLPGLYLGEKHDPTQLRQEYDRLWREDLRGHCPGCFINCNVDYHYRRIP